MLVSPVNLSWGRPGHILDALVAAAGHDLLDIHVDPHHHRSVLTVVGESAPRRLAEAAVALIDLRAHVGAHPRLGSIDVVPFVPAEGRDLGEARAARDAFVAWAAGQLRLPALCYGDDGPTLPQVRKTARGTVRAHPTAGAVCVSARGPLVAYNVWLEEPDLATARQVAREIRGQGIRALGIRVGDRVQVSMNLVTPTSVGPGQAYDAVRARVAVSGAELVGLLPREVLQREPWNRWLELDLAEDRTVEHRLAARR